MNSKERYWQAKKVTLIGALCNGLLGVVKLAGGYLFHSHALAADGVHSFSDLLTDVMVLFASKYGSQDADESHPYGHQRIETAATLLLALLLILAGFGIAWDALDELIHATDSQPGWLTLPIICSSIVINELLFHYTRYVGLRINSALLKANAWHHRSDAASSFVVLVGLIGSLAGFTYLDSISAIIVGLMIIKMGWDYGWNSVKELVDTAVNPELFAQIEELIQTVPGVRKIHQLRSRFMGSDVLIDVHIMVAPKISVSEGHYIAQNVHHALIDQIASVKDVVVHVDPEDDEICNPSRHLPNRMHLQMKFFDALHQEFPEFLFWNVHYLDGAFSLDIVCTEDFKRWDELNLRLDLGLKDHFNIKEIRLFHKKLDKSLL